MESLCNWTKRLFAFRIGLGKGNCTNDFRGKSTPCDLLWPLGFDKVFLRGNWYFNEILNGYPDEIKTCSRKVSCISKHDKCNICSAYNVHKLITRNLVVVDWKNVYICSFVTRYDVCSWFHNIYLHVEQEKVF